MDHHNGLVKGWQKSKASKRKRVTGLNNQTKGEARILETQDQETGKQVSVITVDKKVIGYGNVHRGGHRARTKTRGSLRARQKGPLLVRLMPTTTLNR